MGLQFSRQNFCKRWIMEPPSISVYAVPWWQSVHPRLLQSAAGSYQDATATKLGSLGAGISAAQACCLASDWLPRVGMGIRIGWHLSHNCLGSWVWSHQYLAA
jgi:hypothetical protein